MNFVKPPVPLAAREEERSTFFLARERKETPFFSQEKEKKLLFSHKRKKEGKKDWRGAPRGPLTSQNLIVLRRCERLPQYHRWEKLQSPSRSGSGMFLLYKRRRTSGNSRFAKEDNMVKYVPNLLSASVQRAESYCKQRVCAPRSRFCAMPPQSTAALPLTAGHHDNCFCKSHARGLGEAAGFRGLGEAAGFRGLGEAAGFPQ